MADLSPVLFSTSRGRGPCSHMFPWNGLVLVANIVPSSFLLLLVRHLLLEAMHLFLVANIVPSSMPRS